MDGAGGAAADDAGELVGTTGGGGNLDPGAGLGVEDGGHAAHAFAGVDAELGLPVDGDVLAVVALGHACFLTMAKGAQARRQPTGGC